MPNPFNPVSKPQDQSGVVDVTDSQLFCESCGYENSEGNYYEAKNLLVFTCGDCGHFNQVEIEL